MRLQFLGQFEWFAQVDATGAGLELTPDPYGFLIETVFETPGQKPGTEATGAHYGAPYGAPM